MPDTPRRRRAWCRAVDSLCAKLSAVALAIRLKARTVERGGASRRFLQYRTPAYRVQPATQKRCSLPNSNGDGTAFPDNRDGRRPARRGS
ncbi:hypothetical protein KCP73_03020 [Salmonella enterica subsp. enterica]|nr:hypothetical protein KCP73_03020 [Salmonella enterica subsp. enterica]